VDAGAVILQEAVTIGPDDTVHTLVRRTKVEVGAPLLLRALALIEAGPVAGRPVDPAAGRAFGYPDGAAIRRFRARGRRFI
jgi:methionyl-tRNA formyltransferase